MTEHLQINDVAPRIQYDCDGIQTAYIYPFAVFRTADLEVWQDGARVNSGFSVSGAGISSGGVVLFAVPPVQGSRLTLRRRVALERVSDFQTDGIIRAKTLNDELDYQVAAVQQVADDVSRCLQRPFTSTSTADLSLPEPQAGRGLKWADDGLSLVNSDYDPDAPAATAGAREAAEAAAAAAALSASQAQAAVGGVQVSGGDTAPGPLVAKLQAEGPLVATVHDSGGSETLRLSLGGVALAQLDVRARAATALFLFNFVR